MAMQLKHLAALSLLHCTDALARLFPMWIEGTDTQGRPVFYKPFASWRLDELVNRHGATPATLCAYLTYAQDRAFHVALGNASRERSVEQVVVVLDALRLRWTWGLPSRDGVRITRAMVRLDEAHYPERLGALYILNAGKGFAPRTADMTGAMAIAFAVAATIVTWVIAGGIGAF